MSKKQNIDALDELVANDPLKVIALMLWKNRLREPNLYVQIEEKDIKGLADSCQYLKVTPTVSISRPQGVPAQEAIPAVGRRRAVPGRAAIPPKPYVIVQLVDSKSFIDPVDGSKHWNAIKPVENNQSNFDASESALAVRKAREQAPQIVQRLLGQARTGEYSLSEIQDACNALMTLASA